MRRWLLLRRVAVAFMVCLTAVCCLQATVADEKKPLRVCILSGCPTYASEQSLPLFQKWLEDHYAVQCRRLIRVADDDLPGLENLDDCDVILVFFKRMKLKGEQLAGFQKYVRSGRPIVAVRTASHAVQTWLEFDPEILGGNYRGHYEKEPVTVIHRTKAGEDHPILKDVNLTTAPGPLYKNAGHARDINILLNGENPGQLEPIAWTREVNGGRLFYTSLGDPKTFEDKDFRVMLANALFWTSGNSVPVLKP
jgi:type 1 glutamine amidotransferase